jgi:hypothetical protein
VTRRPAIPPRPTLTVTFSGPAGVGKTVMANELRAAFARAQALGHLVGVRLSLRERQTHGEPDALGRAPARRTWQAIRREEGRCVQCGAPDQVQARCEGCKTKNRSRASAWSKAQDTVSTQDTRTSTQQSPTRSTAS